MMRELFAISSSPQYWGGQRVVNPLGKFLGKKVLYTSLVIITRKFLHMAIIWSYDFHLFVLAVRILRIIVNIKKQSLF